jgi:cyclin D3, plant
MTFSTMIDPLCCHEEHLDLPDYREENEETKTTTPASLDGEGRETNLQLLHSLCHKETETNPTAHTTTCALSYLLSGARRDMVKWMTCAVAMHGFTTQTALLSVNYLDRCFLSGLLQLQHDKPWMGRLAAIACLSLGAKVEETQVPLLLDLQLPVTWGEEAVTDGGAGFLFEAKTVRRMELLVLSALQWRLNSVTALSFIQPLVSLLFSVKMGGHLTARCEGILLSVLDGECLFFNFFLKKLVFFNPFCLVKFIPEIESFLVC